MTEQQPMQDADAAAMSEATAQVATLLVHHPKPEIVQGLVNAGWPIDIAIGLVDKVDADLNHVGGVGSISEGANYNFLWAPIIALGVVLFLGYNNVVAFRSGYDGCRWGEPTETQCGIEVYGTGKGRLVAPVLYGPGFLLGKVFSPNDGD